MKTIKSVSDEQQATNDECRRPSTVRADRCVCPDTPDNCNSGRRIGLFLQVAQGSLAALVILLSPLFILLSSCSDDDDTVDEEPRLEVSYATLDGTWQLTQWAGGQSLSPGTYCYIVFARRDHTFRMYHNFDSMYARCITGTFTVDYDARLGYLLTGTYDYGQGSWNNTYIVTDLLPSGSMTWTVKTDPTDICRYVRCTSVPDNILQEAEGTEE